jgi:hypothetical protein
MEATAASIAVGEVTMKIILSVRVLLSSLAIAFVFGLCAGAQVMGGIAPVPTDIRASVPR